MSKFHYTSLSFSAAVYALAVALLSTATTAQGAPIVAYTDGGANGNNTGHTGGINIGREFSVTSVGGDTAIEVFSLGAFAKDASGNPLTFTNAHTVDLFSIGSPGTANPTNTLLASVVVPAGTAAPYDDGFRFASLSTPLILGPGNYAVIAYGLNDGNAGYGDGGGRLSSVNANDLNFDPYVLPTTSVSPVFPTNGDSNDHNGASFTFTAVPEPSSFVLSGLGVVGLVLAARRRRKV